MLCRWLTLASQEQDDNYAEKQPIQDREQNIAITDKTLMCKSCASNPLIDFQHSSGISLYPNVTETLPWTLKKASHFYCKVGAEAWGWRWWVYTQSALQASTSQVCLQLLVLAGSWEMRERRREGWKRGENAISLSLAKYTPSGSIMDRISAGQEMILVRSRKQRGGSSAELDWERGNEGCPWVRIELARQLYVNGNICAESW